jgi:alpha-1,6-mannosyltransferase
LTVLDITKFFGATTGGIRTYLVEKAKYVAARESHRQVVIVPARRQAVVTEGRTRWYHLPGPAIPTQAPYRFLLSSRRIREVLTAEKPEIIEVGSPYLVPWLTRRAARHLRVPLVWFYHTDFPRIISPRPERDGSLRRMAGRLAGRYVARLAPVFDAAIGASRVAVQALAQAGFPRVERVPLGVDLDRFHPRRREHASRTRSEYGLPSGPLAIFAGRLAREKELGLVIDAWPRVERATGATLVLVGDGPSRKYFQARARAKQIAWLPYETDRDRLADLLASADLYLAPGPAETFGLAALEAMASGLPVIASDRGAVRELVEDSGAGAVNPGPSADTMGESIIRLLEGDCAALGARARNYAETHHSWTSVFDRLFSVYQRLLASRG